MCLDDGSTVKVHVLNPVTVREKVAGAILKWRAAALRFRSIYDQVLSFTCVLRALRMNSFTVQCAGTNYRVKRVGLLRGASRYVEMCVVVLGMPGTGQSKVWCGSGRRCVCYDITNKMKDEVGKYSLHYGARCGRAWWLLVFRECVGKMCAVSVLCSVVA